MNSLPNSYAALGRQLPAQRITGAPASAAANPQSAIRNPQLSGWIMPQAQVRWLGPGVAWYTPQRVEQIWRQAIAGDLASSWEMFDLMESTWPCLSKCLNQIKDAVVSQGIRVLPFTPKNAPATPEAIDRAAFVESALQGMAGDPARDENDLEDTIRDLLDARGKGLSVLEVDWETRVQSPKSKVQSPESQVPGEFEDSAFSRQPLALVPRCTRWVHPAWYGYPYGPGSGLLQLRAPARQNNPPATLKTPFPVAPGDTSMGYGYNATATWMDFPEHKFIIGMLKNKTGHPLGSALLHTLAFWWAASNFTAEWFLNFCQVFGQPFRWANYDPSMSVDDQQKLQVMLTTMGSSAWGMFPAGTTFELKDVAAKSGDNIQIALMDLADKQCTQLVLRQSLTSDVGGSGSRALGEVHERVLGGVEDALGKWICKTLGQLVRSICILNYNTDAECPTLVNGMDEEASPEELGKLLVDVKNSGLQPTDDALPDLGERLGFPVERQAAAPVVGQGPEFEVQSPKTKVQNQGEEEEIDPKSTINNQKSEAVSGAAVGAGLLAGPAEQAALEGVYKGSMAPFRQIILGCATRDECLTRLARAYADWQPGRLASQMEEALQIAAAGKAEKLKS